MQDSQELVALVQQRPLLMDALMDYAKLRIEIDILPYGLERLMKLLSLRGVTEVKVEEIRLYKIASGKPSVNDYHPLHRVSFIVEAGANGLVEGIRHDADAGPHSYFKSITVTPVFRHLEAASQLNPSLTWSQAHG